MPLEIRADIVGSLLRPAELKAALSGATAATEEEIRRLGDQAVIDAIKLQKSVGLKVVTDGELRRRVFMITWASLDGFTPIPDRAYWKGPDGKELIGEERQVVTSPIKVKRQIAQDEFAFLKQHASGLTKYTIPAPSMGRGRWHKKHSRQAYPRVEDFLYAVRDYTRTVVREIAAMGCDYIQLDAPIYADIADPEYRRSMADLGSAYGENLAFDAELDNSVFEGLKGVTTAIHLCRGNNAGRWLASGSYDAVAAQLFPRLKMDRLLLEFDSPRAGGFEPLKFVNKDTFAVLGLITTKTGKLEDPVALQARIREAAKYHDSDRLAVSPQCGFASSLQGNPLSMSEQEAKLRLVVETAQKAWGSA